MDLDDLRRNWEEFGRTIPMRSILWQQRPWEVEDFFASGRNQVDGSMDFLESLGAKPSGKALDFGCGIGRLTQALAGHFDQVVGTDIAASMIEQANAFNQFPERCHYVVNQADNLRQFDDESFDFVYSLIVLQHVGTELAKHYIVEFMRILRPGGVAMFQLPSKFITPAPLPPKAMQAELKVVDPVEVAALRPETGSSVAVRLQITNISPHRWDEKHRVALGGHWFGAHDRITVDDQGPWVPLVTPLDAGDRQELLVEANAPSSAGDYILWIDLHHSRVASFSSQGSEPLEIPIKVVSSGGSAPDEVDTGKNAPDTPPPSMQMQGVTRREVERILIGQRGQIVSIREDALAGSDWRSFLYVVRKRPKHRMLRRLTGHG